MFRQERLNPACGLLVVDEASMMDMFFHLLKAVPAWRNRNSGWRCQQLHNRGPGSMLATLSSRGRVIPWPGPAIFFRQSVESGIICNAHRSMRGQGAYLTWNRTDFLIFILFRSVEAEKAAELIVDLGATISPGVSG